MKQAAEACIGYEKLVGFCDRSKDTSDSIKCGDFEFSKNKY